MADKQDEPGDRAGQNQQPQCFMNLVQEEF